MDQSNQVSDGFISVVVPTYHRNDLLAKCLTCLAPGTQTIDPSRYEVIVTDDGKTSTAEQMIRERFPWAKWVKGPQRGPAANRNNGAKQARGEWLAFTDDDCLPTPGWLAAYSAAIEDDVDFYEGKTTCLAGCRPWVEDSPVNLDGGMLWSCNMMVRKTVYFAMNGFDERYPKPMMEDVDFNERRMRRKLPVRWTPEALIDHPPRLRHKGIELGKFWESRVLFIFKFSIRRSCLVWLPLHVAKVRASQIKKIGFRREAVIASWNCILEWCYLVCHVRKWERKYRSMDFCG